MFSSTNFWLLIGLAIFVAILWRTGAFVALFNGLDGRTRRVEGELAEARRLREEAQALLASFKARQKEAEAEAAAIVAQAKADAARAADEARSRLDDFITRRTAMAETKIAQAEAQAAGDVRAAAAEAAVRASEAALRVALPPGGSTSDEALLSALSSVKGRLN